MGTDRSACMVRVRVTVRVRVGLGLGGLWGKRRSACTTEPSMGRAAAAAPETVACAIPPAMRARAAARAASRAHAFPSVGTPARRRPRGMRV